MEVAVAAVVIASVSLLGVGPRSGPGRGDAGVVWDSRATPVLTALVGDLTALQSDASPGGDTAAARSSLALDASRLRRDLSAARALPPPPSASLRSQWSSALERLASAAAESDHVIGLQGGTPAVAQQAYPGLGVAVAQAAESLLRLAGSLR